MAITTNNLISRQTVGSAGAATVTFSSIPQTFTDLRVVVSGRSIRSAVNDVLYMTVNGSATTYSSKVLEGNGATPTSYNGGSTAFSDILGIPAASSTASVFSNAEIYIPNYTSANYKSISADSVGENNATTAYTDLYAGLWSNTAAITSITLYNTISNFAEFTTISLYGISSNTSTQNTSVPSATGGDVITTDGTYWYHAFIASGTFTPLKALTADCLVVAGGASGGGQYAGGGGAGGVVYDASRSLSSQNYTVTIGGGGAAIVNSSANGNNGSDTSLGTLVGTGGGGGANWNGAGVNGLTGGSGGGGSMGTSAGNTTSGGAANQGASTGDTGYGNAGGGGLRAAGNVFLGGGGGGAGGAGVAATGTVAGNGGAGINTYSSLLNATSLGVSGYIAGGGGGGAENGTGGTGGSGGGGAGGTAGGGTSATVNTGSAGGGVGYNTTVSSGGGGSGIVLIRYVV